MVRYKEEKYSDILKEIEALLPMFFEEVDKYPHSPKPDIDHDALLDMEMSNSLQVITTRRKEDLVGFHISLIMPDLFYKGTNKGYVAFYYLLPEYRGEGRGTGMFSFADKKFNEKEVEMVYMSHKSYIDCSKMFKSLGYVPFEQNYYRVVE